MLLCRSSKPAAGLSPSSGSTEQTEKAWWEGGRAGAGDEYDVMILLHTPSTEMVRSPGFLG